MLGRAIGHGFATARDVVARGLLRAHVTPNVLTLLGTAFTLGVGVCLAVGAGAHFAWSLDPHSARNAYPLLAFGLLILSCACDMLDGAVARLGNLQSRFGAFLDSTMDRFSDFAVFGGIAMYYARQDPANLTFVLLGMLGFFNAFMISYSRARAEDLIPACRVGYWQRGERLAAVLIATAAANVPALVVQQALLPLLTVVRRIGYTWNVLEGRQPLTDPRQGNWWLRVRLWRYPRMTPAYDFVTALNIAWLLFVPVPETDLLRAWPW